MRTTAINKLWAAAAVAAVLLVCLLAPQEAVAQNVRVTAEVDRTSVDLTETFTLTVTVYDQMSLPLPVLPHIDGVLLTGRDFNDYRYIYNNGQFSAQATFKYVFQPIRTGRIEIGPISITVDNYVYNTQPIFVRVSGGQGQPSVPALVTPPRVSDLMGQNFHSEAEVDNLTPYVGEQITYTFRFYASDGRRRPVFNAPDFAGFWNGGEQQPEKSAATEAGRRYTVTEVDTILFPILAGENSIEPGRMSLPGGVFGAANAEFPSETIELSVKPLPGNAPDSFTGAVGQYRISARLDKDTTVVGDPVEMLVFIEGLGNFENLPEPIWTTPVGWRALDADSAVTTSVLEGRAAGQKTYERVLIPESPGIYQIPPVKYSYFNPYLERYVTVSTDLIQVEVMVDPSAAANAFDVVGGDEQPSAVDIRHIKPLLGGLRGSDGNLVSVPMFWGMWSVPAIAVAIVLIWQVIRRRQAAMRARFDPIAARESAIATLMTLPEGSSAADAAAATLHAYLGAVLRRQTGGLSAPEMVRLLREHGVTEETAAQLQEALEKLDELRFSPAGVGSEESGGPMVAEVVLRIGEELAQ